MEEESKTLKEAIRDKNLYSYCYLKTYIQLDIETKFLKDILSEDVDDTAAFANYYLDNNLDIQDYISIMVDNWCLNIKSKKDFNICYKINVDKSITDSEYDQDNYCFEKQDETTFVCKRQIKGKQVVDNI